MTYRIIQGDATCPLAAAPVIIPHIVNSVGAWGSGFVVALSKRWSKPEQQYREWFLKKISRRGSAFELGEVGFVQAESNIYVANMIAQSGIGTHPRPPIRYAALASCMIKVLHAAQQLKAEVHCPRFGAGLAGGNWEVIEQLIHEVWVDYDLDVVVYEYP